MEKKSAPQTTMRKVFSFLVSSLGYAKGNKVFDDYCKQYGVRIDDQAPDAIILDAFARYGRF